MSTDDRPRCPFCLHRFERAEVAWLEFTPPHPPNNRLLAERGEHCSGTGLPLEDPPVLRAWERR